jgi:plastocyanin
MNIKKTLISVGLSAALSAVPLIAQADLVSNTAINAGVDVLVKDSASLTGQKLVLTEKSVIGAVSAGTIVLALDNNAEIVSATTAATGMTLSDSVSDGKLTITITAVNTSTSLGTITISGLTIKTSSSSVGAEIKISKDSSSTATGATFPALKIATIVDPSVTIENVSGTIPSFKAGLSVTLLDILISENAEGAIDTLDDENNSVTDAITVTLPSGWTFEGTPTIAASNATVKDPIDNTVTIKDVTSSKIAIKAKIKAPVGVSNGDVKADVTVKLSNGETKSETLVVGKVEESGIKAIVVDKSTAVFDAEKAAATKVPEVPIGKLNAQLNSIMVMENFGNDLTTDDKLVLTLPTGVKFTSTGAANLDQMYITLGTVSDPNSDNKLTIPITDGGTDLTSANSKGGVLIIKSGIIVNIAEDAPEGDIKAVLTGTVNGVDFAAIDLIIGKIIKGGTTNEANSDIKTVGVGSSNVAIAKFTLTEVVPGALKGNNKTITLTLPDGVTWTDKTSAPVCTESNITIGDVDGFTDGDKVATFLVTAVSISTAGKITCSGNINIKADFKPGDIEVTIGGTAGATEDKVLIAKAATGTSVAVGDVPQLKAGVSAKAIATITITESFAGSLSKNGKFRIQLPEGLVWTAALPTVSTELKSGESGTKLVKDIENPFVIGFIDTENKWEFDLATTITVNDTLVIQVPNTASDGATVISFAELKINIPDGRADGLIEVKLFDGNAAGSDGAGVTEESKLLVGVIGAIPEFKVDPLTVKVAVGATVEVTASGGLGTAKVGTVADVTIATATIENGKVTITGVKEGKTSVIVSDGSATAQTKTVEIEVTPAEALKVDPATVEVEVGKTVEVTISGGKAGYTATSSDNATASVTIKDTKVTIKGEKEGTATITVEDSADPKGKVEITVTVKAADTTPTPTPPPLTGPNKDGKGSGVDKDGKPVTSDAKFSGGVSIDGGITYSTEAIPEDKPITVAVKIEVDPAHKDKKGKYYVVAGYQQDAAAAPFWWFYKEDKSWVDWAPVDIATRVLYKETETLGTIEIEIAKDLSLKGFKGNYFVFLAYETADDGAIYFNLPAIEFTIK